MACLLARTPVKAIAIGGIDIRRKLTAKPLNGPRPRCATNIACMLADVIQRFRWIALGSFMMGSPEGGLGRRDDETQYTVTLNTSFWLAECVVTQTLWQAVMNENPSRFKGENSPVETISFNAAKAFIDKLNNMKPVAGR